MGARENEVLGTPAEAWEARYLAARAALDATARLVKLAALVEETREAERAVMAALTGGERLATARAVCVFAGSFNPLTWAHLAVMEAARSMGGVGSAGRRFDALVWLMATTTVEKERVQRASVVDRLAQLEALGAAGEASGVGEGVITALTNRGLYLEQAEALRGVVGDEAEMTLVVGFDKIRQILDPRYYSDRAAALGRLFAQARVLVAPRGADGAETLEALLSQPEHAGYRGAIGYLDVPVTYAEESSTAARSLAADDDGATDGATDAAPRAELRRLAAPEGYALVETGAYRLVEARDADAYWWRLRWLETLRPLATAGVERGVERAGSLARLTGVAMEASARGAWLRETLTREDVGAGDAGRERAREALARAGG